MRRFFIGFAAMATLAALGGCRSISPAASAPPDPPAGGASLLSDDQRSAARKLYVAKCARCHKFYDPARYPDKEWRDWMKKMSRKAKLQPEQEKLLIEYLDLYRAKTNAAGSK
jgi:cytochrome c553